MKNIRVSWGQLIIFTIWFLSAALMIGLSLTDNVPSSFRVPRILSWLYDALGILWASVVQLVLSGLGIFASFSKSEAPKTAENQVTEAE